MSNDLLTLIEQYWNLAYAEGKEGRTHDTETGDAQRVLHQIKDAIAALEAAKLESQPVPQKFEMPDEPELFKFINSTPILQSLLYDINLLPEQIEDPIRWGYMIAVCSHFEMALINKTAQPVGVPAIDVGKHNRIEQRLCWIEQGGLVNMAELIDDIRSMLSAAPAINLQNRKLMQAIQQANAALKKHAMLPWGTLDFPTPTPGADLLCEARSYLDAAIKRALVVQAAQGEKK